MRKLLEKEKDRVEGNKKVYVKLREPILIAKEKKIMVGLNQENLELLVMKRYFRKLLH